MEHNVGTTILGRVELLREEPASVGVQVFGPTWAVLDSESGELARACVLDAELLPDRERRDAFVASLSSLANLREPTLVPQLQVGADDHGASVLYEPLPGGVAFDDLYDGTGSFELSAEVGRLARQLARALASLHAHGVVHGMLTSACVFVGPRGPAVYQYGLAPLCDRAVLLRRVRAFGLPNLAPEVASGGEFTPAADLYAWAVTVAQFATSFRGTAAIEAVRAGQELPGLGPALRGVLQACLADDPAARPRDGGELLRLIEVAGLGEGSGAARPEDLAPPPVPEDSSRVPEASPGPSPTNLSRGPDSDPAPAVASAGIHAVPEAASPAGSAPVVASPQRGPAVARPATIPPRRPPSIPVISPALTSAPPSSMRASKDRPGTIPPTGMSLPVTSFEEMLMTGDRQRRPGTIPPGSMQAVSAASAVTLATSTAAPAAAASASNRIELSPEDLMHESGSWSRSGQATGKPGTRRVRVLTDPLKRTGEHSALTPVGRATQPEDLSGDSSLTPIDSSATSAVPGDLIIGGTREELDAVSRATTVRLDPASAAAAVHAATGAAQAEHDRSSTPAAEPAHSSVADAVLPAPAGASGPTLAPADTAEAPSSVIASADATSGAPVSSSAARRRSSAMSASNNGEPRDWGTIPPMGPSPMGPPPPGPPAGAPLGPPSSPVPVASTPVATDTDVRPPSRLIPILVLVALALLAILFASS
ncbi:protein kinase [Nannocystis sp.]|uniref:protein kinase n=1 Tax=Nannocystis sp. TaxID=1962667 RepID=UPI0025EE1FCE|nr:protein kinase [Nannocystis sp.]MBK7823971.1 protein kinase [Nannocystis sp.]